MSTQPQLLKLFFLAGGASWLCLEGCWLCGRAAYASEASSSGAQPPLSAEPTDTSLGQESPSDLESLRAVVEESWLQESLWAPQESWIDSYIHEEQEPTAPSLALSRLPIKPATAGPSSLEEVKEPASSQAAPRKATRARGLLLRGLLVLLAAGGLFRLIIFTGEERERELSEEEVAKKQELLRSQAQLQLAAESLSRAVGTREAAVALGSLQQNLYLSEQLVRKVGDPGVSPRLAGRYGSLMTGAVEAANQLQRAARDTARKLSLSLQAPPASGDRWPTHVGGESIEGFEGVQAAAITLHSLQTCGEALGKQAQLPARQVIERRRLRSFGDSPLLSATSLDLERLNALADLRGLMDNESMSLTTSTLHAIKSALLLSRRQLRTPLRTEVGMLIVLHRRAGERASEALLPSASHPTEEEALLREATEKADQYAEALREIEGSDSLASLQQANQQAVVLEEQLKELVGCLWRWWQDGPDFEKTVVEAEGALSALVSARSAEAAREAQELEEKVKQLLEDLEQKLIAASTSSHPYAHPEIATKLLTETRNLKSAAVGGATRAVQQHTSSSPTPPITSAGGRRVIGLSEAARVSLEKAFFAHALSTAVEMIDLNLGVLELLQRDALRSSQVHARALRCNFSPPVRGSQALIEAQNEFNAASAAARKAESIEGLAQATARMRSLAVDLEALMYESGRLAHQQHEGSHQHTAE